MSILRLVRLFCGIAFFIFGWCVVRADETDRGKCLDRAQGKWKMDSISIDGVRIEENNIYRNATAEVKGQMLTNKISPGDFVYELGVVDESKDPVPLTLTGACNKKLSL